MSEWAVELPTVNDYDRPAFANGKRQQRHQTVGEALSTALDSLKRPDYSDAMALLCRAARGDNVQADAAAMLQALCDRIGEQHAEVE
jgi:TPR repeat protein